MCLHLYATWHGKGHFFSFTKVPALTLVQEDAILAREARHHLLAVDETVALKVPPDLDPA